MKIQPRTVQPPPSMSKVLTLPTTLTNATASAMTYTVTIVARVSNDGFTFVLNCARVIPPKLASGASAVHASITFCTPSLNCFGLPGIT